ncbi:hypothetical protein LJB98_04380 [Bacteroidales bacterium OttesenSCG-928-M11]|nr:hypothetical protein [Bacteroidales bacterium OttesenSCG-928-M11]
MRNLFYIVLVCLIASFMACDDGFDDYSTNPNDTLTFSVDTLCFDTLLTTINTPTASFKVYNKNKKDILISSIQLKEYAESGFRINVDGLAGDSFENIEIRSKDSLYVFVEAKLSETGVNAPVEIEDMIEFVTNTVSQSVCLKAYAQDAVIWKGVIIEEDTSLSNEKPYLLYDSLFIKEGITLTIPEGTTLYMHGKTNILVDGCLQIKGTADRPVLIRGDRFDNIFTNASYDLVPGQWGSIRFSSTSYNNTIEYANIRNGTNALLFDPSEVSSSKLSIRNTVIKNFKGYIMYAVNCDISAENCEFSNSLNALVTLIGGRYSFVHCTMANHYLSSKEAGWGISNDETLILSNKYYLEGSADSVLYPIERADFKNVLIWGSKPINGSSRIRINEHEKSSMSYFFLNCLFPNKGTNDNDFVDCIWDTDPLFSKSSPGKGEDEDYLQYDFSLSVESPARNKGDLPTAVNLPIDINGVSRFLDEGPDIGAYEFRNVDD